VPLDVDSVDFIIPAHNEAATIADLIRVIRRWPLAGKIVVIDDDSVDWTFKCAREAGPDVLETVFQDRGKTGAVQAGVKYTCSEFVACMDGDWRNFGPDFFDGLMERSGRDGIYLSSGGYWIFRRELLDRLSDCNYFYPDQWLINQAQESGQDVVVTSYLSEGMTDCREIYRHIGGLRYYGNPERHDSRAPYPQSAFAKVIKPVAVVDEAHVVPIAKGLGLNLSL
jgi:hypothetical protein